MMRNRSLRAQPDRLMTLKRGSIRGLQSILSVQSASSPYGSNSSIDGRVSPSPSFATSTHEVGFSLSIFFLRYLKLLVGTVWVKLVVPESNARICVQSVTYHHPRGARRR